MTLSKTIYSDVLNAFPAIVGNQEPAIIPTTWLNSSHENEEFCKKRAEKVARMIRGGSEIPPLYSTCLDLKEMMAIVVLDGNHRLIVASRLGVEVLPAHIVAINLIAQYLEVEANELSERIKYDFLAATAWNSTALRLLDPQEVKNLRTHR